MLNQLEIADYLLENGASTKITDINGKTVAHYMAKYADELFVKAANKIEIFDKDEKERYPLHYAAIFGSSQTRNYYINNCDESVFHEKDNDDEPPSAYYHDTINTSKDIDAKIHENIKRISKLNISKKSKAGIYIDTIKCIEGIINCSIKFDLIKKFTKTDWVEEKNHNIIIMYLAAKRNRYDLFKTLIDSDTINVVIKDDFNVFTIFYFAAKMNNYELFEYVYAKLWNHENFDRNAFQDILHKIFLVACRKYEEIVYWFCKNRNDLLNICDNEKFQRVVGHSLLQAVDERRLDILAMLIENNVDSNETFDLTEPLSLALRICNKEMVLYLLNNMTENDVETYTLLDYCNEIYDSEMNPYLLNNTIEVDVIKNTPLDYCKKTNDFEIFAAFANKTAIMRTYSVLHWAATNGVTCIIKWFIENKQN